MTSCSTESLHAGDTAPVKTSLDQIPAEGQLRQFGPDDRSAANAASGEGESLSEPREGGGADTAEAVPTAGGARDDDPIHQSSNPASKIEAALRYAQLGARVFPVANVKNGICICGKKDCPGKHPMGHLAPRGFIGATTDQEQITKWWQKAPDANIGVVPGPKYLVADLDNKGEKNGFATLQVLQAKHGDDTLLDTDVVVMTPSGGQHRWFSVPEGASLREGQDALGPGIDVRYVSGYVLAPPSTIPAGDYTFDGDGLLGGVLPTEAPAALIELLLKSGRLRCDNPSAPAPSKAEATELVHNVETLWPCTPFTIAEMREALAYIDERDDYDLWVKVGMALKATNWGEQAFDLWVEWARLGAKFDRQRVGGKQVSADGLAIHAKHWKSFKRQPAPGQPCVQPATIFWLAKQYGYPGRPSPEVAALRGPGEPSLAALTVEGKPPSEPSDAVFDEAKLAAAAQQVSAPALPNVLLRPPGILNEIAAHIRDNFMVHPIPIFAVAGALAVVSIGMARSYRTKGRVYPNIYIIVSGVSTGGKDAAPQAVGRILSDVGLGACVAGKPGSGPGFQQQLVDSPVSIFLIDEFGYVMEGITDKRAPAYKKAIYEEILKAFTSADNPHYLGDALARDKREKREDKLRAVSHPAPVMLATTTPTTLWNNLSSKDALSGLLGRCLVFEHQGKPPGKTMVETEAFDRETPEPIREWFRCIRTAPCEGEYPSGMEPGDITGIMPGSRVVSTDQASRELFDKFGREAEDTFNRAESKTAKAFAPGGVVWGRAKELAIRIAILCAGAVDPIEPRITAAEAEWAIALTRYCLATMEFIANTTLFDSIAHKNKHLFYQAVLRSGSKGLSKGDVYNASASNPLKDMTKREKDDAIAELQLGEVIEYRVVKRDRWGRVRREAWVATELLKWDGALEEEASAVSRPGASRQRSGTR